MIKALISPAKFVKASVETGMSPGIMSGNFLCITGMAGGDLNGNMPDDPAEQFQNAFDKIGMILEDASLDFDAVVEMTSYHIGLRKHFETFDAMRREVFDEPFPAWTAVEVAGLRREGALSRQFRVIVADFTKHLI